MNAVRSRKRRLLPAGRRVAIVLALIFAPALLLPASITKAGEPQVATFERVWERTDRPVAEMLVSRTWIWGPAPISEVLREPARVAADEGVAVQYFDKGRMEIADPSADPTTPQYVQSGRVIIELATGRIEAGDGVVRQFAASDAAVAGDPDESNAVTYRTVATLLDLPPHNEGELLATRVSPAGNVSDAVELEIFGVTAGAVTEETNHAVASVFSEFLASAGIVWNGESFVEEALFTEQFAGTGPPITEAYWHTVQVAGVEHDVLLQCFERRCLTFTPGNAAGWQVEVANSGSHYYDWRYNQIDFDDPPDADEDETLPEALYVTADGDEHSMRLEVAATDPTRACGLMHRDSLDADTGMLFVWEFDLQGAFWNCNTFVPLTLAWIDADGHIIGFSEMEAQTRGEPQNVISYPPPGPFRYVVEANQGWFAARDIGIGDRAILAQALARGDTGSDTLCQELGLACN